MSNIITPTKFAEIWTEVSESFFELDHLRSMNLGAIEHVLQDTASGSVLTPAQIEAYKKPQWGIAGNTPIAPKLPYIKASNPTVDPATLQLCTLGADSTIQTAYKTLSPTGLLRFQAKVDWKEFAFNAVSAVQAFATDMKDQINKAWTVLNTKAVALLEADKNVYFPGSFKLPTGWAVVGDAIQVPYTDLNRLFSWLPTLYQNMSMSGKLLVDCDNMFLPQIRFFNAQGSANNTNYAYQFDDTKFSVKPSNITNGAGVSHTLYVRPQGNTVTFERIPDAFYAPAGFNENIDGKFATSIEGMVADLPFAFGRKLELACNTDVYASLTGNVLGNQQQLINWVTEYYMASRTPYTPASAFSPILKIEILDAVVIP